MKIIKKTSAWLLAIAAAALLLQPAALADTDGSEIQVTDQPDRLILQLGPQWAGTEFDLKTDAGVFPVPVIVDSTGVLKMDLGGSKTYILSCLGQPYSPTGPDASPAPAATAETPPDGMPDGETEAAEPAQPNEGVPAGILITFVIGLAAAGGGLLAMRYYRRRRDEYDYGDDDDYE